jgi:DNA topoisomerase IB
VPATRSPSIRLRRSDTSGPGIRRIKRGKGFAYLNPDDSKVDDAEVLGRIHELVIPPAWTDVWISPYPGGHIQATGIDQKGRKQYLYHPKWRQRRDQAKFDDMVRFARALPAMRERVDADLRRAARGSRATASWPAPCGCSTRGSSASARRTTRSTTRATAWRPCTRRT